MAKIMKPSKKNPFLTLFLCAAGIGATCYGMIQRNNPVFMLGLILVIAGYLIIRKRLKASIRSPRDSEPS